jgi:hypothetical protein
MIHRRHMGTFDAKDPSSSAFTWVKSRSARGYLSCIMSRKSVARKCTRERTAVRPLLSSNFTRVFDQASNPRMSRLGCPLGSSTPLVPETCHCRYRSLKLRLLAQDDHTISVRISHVDLEEPPICFFFNYGRANIVRHILS